jgi:hypothetical protein
MRYFLDDPEQVKSTLDDIVESIISQLLQPERNALERPKD